jgi:hypothetical protein
MASPDPHRQVEPNPIMPNVFEQHRAADDLVRTAHEIFQQIEFARQEMEKLAAAPHGREVGGAHEDKVVSDIPG